MDEDYDTEIAALERQLEAAKQAKANSDANAAKVARIAELRAELATLIPAGTNETLTALQQASPMVGRETYQEVAPPTEEGTIREVVPPAEPVIEGTIHEVVPEQPAPAEPGLIREVTS